MYAISDSIGETAEMVVRAAVSQFETSADIIRIPYIHSIQQIEDVVHEAKEGKCLICHTIVSEELKKVLETLAKQHGIWTVDILGPLMSAVKDISGEQPQLKAGLIHALDKQYFKRVEAVEFAVKYDDGKNPLGILKADLILAGVSRTSKTPLSMYLANKKLKVANVPMVPEVPPPEELFRVSPQRIIGLIIDPYKLNEIRTERLKTMGLSANANYAAIDRISEELRYAKAIMRKLHCTVIDVSNKAIEETANTVMEIAQKNGII